MQVLGVMNVFLGTYKKLIGEKRRTATTETIRGNVEDTVKLNKLTVEDDIEAYLTTFERMMEGSGVNRARWSY